MTGWAILVGVLCVAFIVSPLTTSVYIAWFVHDLLLYLVYYPLTALKNRISREASDDVV